MKLVMTKTLVTVVLGSVVLMAQMNGMHDQKSSTMDNHHGTMSEHHVNDSAKATGEKHAVMETGTGKITSAPVPQSTCPVMGGKIDKTIFADYKGQRVYFCCSGCIEPFKKEPEKYLKKLDSMGQKAEQIASGRQEQSHNAKADVSSKLIPQKTCPVMGNPVNKDLYVDYNGKRIFVCCGMCIDQVKKDPEKYLKKLAEMGEEPAHL